MKVYDDKQILAARPSGIILLRRIDEDLKKRFKSLCARRGITMKERIIQMMRQDLEHWGPK